MNGETSVYNRKQQIRTLKADSFSYRKQVYVTCLHDQNMENIRIDRQSAPVTASEVTTLFRCYWNAFWLCGTHLLSRMSAENFDRLHHGGC